MLHAQGQLDEGLAAAEAALAIVPEDDDYVRSLIYSELANIYKKRNDDARTVEYYHLLMAHCRAAGSLVSELLGVAGLGLYYMERGQLHKAYDLALEGLALVERAGVTTHCRGRHGRGRWCPAGVGPTG
ncbi:MAG: hypothetical protein R3C44_23310 [Chloroflexota bacterium]